MTDLEKYNNQERYPYEVKEKTEEFISLMKEIDIELILVDSPIIDGVGSVEADRSLTYEHLVDLVEKKKIRGSTKLYFYNLQYKFDKICNGSTDFIYSDTFYVRWLFK